MEIVNRFGQQVLLDLDNAKWPNCTLSVAALCIDGWSVDCFRRLLSSIAFLAEIKFDGPTINDACCQPGFVSLGSLMTPTLKSSLGLLTS